MRNKLSNLIEVKKIIAIMLTLVFSYLSIIGTIDSASFLSVFTVVAGFYFGQSTVAQSQIRTHELDKQDK